MAHVDHNYLNENRTSLSNGSATLAGAPSAPYHLKDSLFQVRSFTERILGQNVNFEVLKMNSSVYIWVGPSSNNPLNNMCLSLPTRFDPMPVASPWFGETELSLPVSQKLSKKLKKPVLLSFNVSDHHAVRHIEQALFTDIQNHPEFY